MPDIIYNVIMPDKSEVIRCPLGQADRPIILDQIKSVFVLVMKIKVYWKNIVQRIVLIRQKR